MKQNVSYSQQRQMESGRAFGLPDANVTTIIHEPTLYCTTVPRWAPCRTNARVGRRADGGIELPE